MKQTIIILYCMATLFYGIVHTKSILRTDNLKSSMKYGRVSLICSYWYELYEPRNYIESNGQRKDLFPLIDHAASPIYFKRYYKQK